MDKIRLFKNLERTIAHTDDVEGILGDFAFEILGRARANLARHHKHGTHRVTQDKGTVDHFVNLEGPAALSVENGWHKKDGGFVKGLDILKGAIL
jgi:hypothetical protein